MKAPEIWSPGVAITILFILGLTVSIYAQPKSIRFDHLDIKNGLTHNSVTSIIQDKNGFIWIGTHGGLNRYDGYTIKQFRMENWNANSLPSNNILSIYQDKLENIWLGSQGAGLIRLNPLDRTFTRYTPSNATIELKDVNIITADSEGIVWMATDVGLVRFDIDKDEFISYPFGPSPSNDIHIRSIHEGHSGNFWLATNAGIWKLNRQTAKLSRYLDISASCLYEDLQGMLWIGYDHDLLLYDYAKNQLTTFETLTRRSNQINGIVNDIEQFGNEIWIATNNGIRVINQDTREVQSLGHADNDDQSLADNSVLMFFRDRGNVLWIGTASGGISKTSLTRKNFRHIRHQPGNSNSLNHNNVFALEEDSYGNMWIGTIDGGLDRLHVATQTFTHFMPDPRVAGSISSAKILSLDVGPSGNLWIGTDLDGLCMVPSESLNQNRISFRKYLSSNDINSLSHNVIYSVVESRDNTVWAGTWSKGLNKMVFPRLKNDALDFAHPRITRLEFEHRNTQSISHNVVFKLFEDSKGTLWIGTAGGGLNKHNAPKSAGDKDSFEVFTSNAADSTSVSDNFISAFYESRDGTFWVGTTTGLNRMDRATGKFKSYTMKDGLPSNVVFGILEDDDHRLWLATHHGISRFDPSRETFRNYTVEDGLQGNVFNPDAAHRRTTGEMYFGGTNGITAFFPENIEDNAYQPQVLITDFKVFSRDGKQKEAQNGYMNGNNEITLRKDDYIFTIEFSSTDYAVPGKNKFAYMLEGFDPNWIFTDAGHRAATYTNVDAGTYTLKIKAANEDGLWNETPVVIKVSILPPFWQAAWFKFLSIAGGTVLLLSIYFWRVQTIRHQKAQLERLVFQRTNEILAQKEEIESQKEHIEEKNMLLENQQLHLEKLVEERTLELLKKNMELSDKNQRFEQYGFMTSHNFRGPVATLLGLCNIFNRKDLSDAENLVYIQKIEDTTRRIDEMIRDISTLLNQETNIDNLLARVELEDVVQKVKSLLQEEIRSSGASIQYNFKDAPLVRAVPAYITSIFYNLISNAIKFKKENEKPVIEMQSIQRDRFVMITISDNGAGIDLKKHAPYIFHPFKRFHTNVPGKGLGLYLVKTQLKAMEGDIQVESEEEKGTTFRLSLKVGMER